MPIGKVKPFKFKRSLAVTYFGYRVPIYKCNLKNKKTYITNLRITISSPSRGFANIEISSS